MGWKEVDQIVDGGYADNSRLYSAQETINYIPEYAEQTGTRSSGKLRGAPGWSGAFADTGTGLPIRGAHNAEGVYLVVSGTRLKQINTDGTSTDRGQIPGIGRCSMDHNQITGGAQVAISNGSSGYVYSTVDQSLVQITGDGFIGAKCFAYADSYILGVEPQGRFAFTSDLADATSYSTLDRYEAEGSPDKIVGQIVTHREWWLMGERTIEPFRDTGATTNTWARTDGLVMERGLASTYSPVNLDNSVFWPGNDGSVYRAQGYTPQRISTMPIEQAIAQCNTALCFGFTFEDEGHKIYYLTFPDGPTLGYDVATNKWHRRVSKGLNRWRINTLTNWNGGWYAGDFRNGQIYKLDWNVMSEGTDELSSERMTGVLSGEQNVIGIQGVQPVFDTGLLGSDTTPSYVDIRYSKNGGRTWSNWRTVSLGTVGDFAKTTRPRRWGVSRQWIFHFRVTDPCRRDMLTAAIDIEGYEG